MLTLLSRRHTGDRRSERASSWSRDEHRYQEDTEARPIKADDPGFLTLSNLLSLSRVPLGVAFIAVADPMLMAMLVAVAAATDVLDGFIARVSGTVSHIGLLLDPLCDKLFVLLALSAFLAGSGVL